MLNRKTIIVLLFLGFSLNASSIQAQEKTSGTSKTSVVLNLKVNGTNYEISSLELDKWTTQEARLTLSQKYLSEIENQNICAYKKSIICQLITLEKERQHTKKVSLISPKTEEIRKFIDDLARQTNKDPENAKLSMEGGRASLFSLSKNGLELEKEKSIEMIKKYIEEKKSSLAYSEVKTLELPYKEIKPEVSIDSIENMGITSLIGEGKSNFRGSPKNRVHNIKVATSRFHGILIKPKEEFSFVKILGEVDGEHGYLPELVIKKDKTEPEFGGGICQVSTTAFRAAIYSGLEITARRNHAYPVSYYNPQGMDSTIYIPRPDLRFINDTPGYILIQTQIIGTELTFQFYGTDDGRKTEVIGPKIIERNSDGSMKTTFTQKVVGKNGDPIREDVFNSTYDSPDKYPHPATSSDALTKRPDGWSKSEWNKWKKANGID